jgi:2-polyprenyl-3-methyl-5-hydroxy-6-metoxy-1,4-benzoquinol methylase
MWMINQFNEDLNDAFELHFPPMSPITRWLFKRLTNLVLWGLITRVRAFGGKTVVIERIVEYPVIFSWLPESKGRILDIGCVSSRLPIQLASLGYEVHALDVRPYRYSHRNLTVHQHDLFSWNPNQLFDTVCLISVLEHMGLGAYGDAKLDNADYQAIQRIIHLIKPGGQLIVSVPFGKRGQTWKYRIYDMAQLAALFKDFVWRRSAYFRQIGADWIPALAEDLSEVTSTLGMINGVAILDLMLPD